MSVIFFGLVGVIFGYVIIGMSLMMFLFFGVIVLIGVVVNDSFVMVDFINCCVCGGVWIDDVICEVGVVCFWFIVLMLVIIFVGLMLLLFECGL